MGHGQLRRRNTRAEHLERALPIDGRAVLQLQRARGDAAAYADLRDRYREMAKTLGFDGHIAWAEAMT